jgi:hypothetical protein
MEMVLIVSPKGQVRCIYDELLDLSVLGTISVSRASHVEPDENGRWLANLQPVDGPTLGPFARRSEALYAERNWLQDHWLNPV